MRRLAASLLVLSVAAGACASDADEAVEPSPAPSQPDAVVADGFPLGVYGAGLLSGLIAWGAYAEFHEDGTGRVRGSGQHDSEFTYMVDGDHFEVVATTGDCEAGATGTYRWSAETPALQLTDPVDLCGSREGALHGEWYPLDDTPVVEIDPDGDPITINSPIGPIDWQFVAGQAYAWAGREYEESSRPLVAIDGGFVAVVEEQAVEEQADEADRALVFSSNGIDWQPLPSPPSNVALIAADGETLYLSPAHPPDTVHATVDRGRTWTALEVEDPPSAINGLYAGPSGAVLTGPRAQLWLLGDDSFEKAPDSPLPFVEVLVLDTGFFAVSVLDHHTDDPDDDEVVYWRSDDGRTWDQAIDIPTAGVHEITSWNDDVYLSGWADGIGYTLTDRGRTWSTVTKRPGEGLAVTDAGYFAVQPAIFGPTVGVVWVSSDDVDWQRVVNPWPPLWTHGPVISGDTILVACETDRPVDGLTHLDLVGHIG